MKALTLHQPYASLWASGLKIHETRGWSTSYRGFVAVHASKTKDAADHFDRWANDEGYDRIRPLAFGAIVGVVDLVDCKYTGDGLAKPPWVDALSRTERLFGSFGRRRFGWEAKDAILFREPIPMRGKQGLFDLAPEFEAVVREQMKKGGA